MPDLRSEPRIAWITKVDAESFWQQLHLLLQQCDNKLGLTLPTGKGKP